MDNRYYLIGNAHLDPVWQWCVSEGLSLVKSTFRSALDRMNEFPDYKFTSACASYYKWIKLNEPEMFEEIKQRIEEGRWGVVGAMWVQPDCNIPSGEAFCRHLLYSQKFFLENFGKTAKTGYNVDSFGHNGMLPQIFKKSGIDNYVYMRPNREEEKTSLPEKNFHFWQSPDGSFVKAYRIPDGYGGSIPDERVEYYKAKTQPQMIFYGVGNHGGGPTKEHLRQAENLVKDSAFKYAVPDEYFDETDCTDIPVVSEDLQHHASGCYSANSKVKEANRRAEYELVNAEKFDVLANLLTGSALHSQEITSAWERVMFNQFHDILAGCSIKEAYTEALNAFGSARQTALEVSAFSSQRISWRIRTTDYLDADTSEMWHRLWERDGEGSPIVVFNPHSFPVKTTASFGYQWIAKVVDSNGKEVPFQLVRASYTDGEHLYQCMFNAEIPAYGYKVYYLYRNKENSAVAEIKSDLVYSDNVLENSKVKITFDKETGAVKSYITKADGVDYADGLLGEAVVCDDIKNDTWAHKVTDFNSQIGSFGGGTLELIEKGPIRATIKSTVKYGNSVLKRYYSLYQGCDRLFVRCMLDFDEEYKLAKLSFKVKVTDPSVTYSMPYGFITKTTNGEEEPSHTWCDISDESGFGMGLVNDSKYSFCAIDNDLRMMVARGCAYLDHYAQKYRDTEMQFLDKYEQEFNYELVPHTKRINSELFREGEILNYPVQVQQETHHDGALPQEYGAMNIDNESVVVTSLKQAEDGNGFILRAVETNGEKCEAVIDIEPLNAHIKAQWNPQEIKTFRILKDGKFSETMITE